MKSPKVSVIVPVYNTEKYLPACLDSIINQTFKDIEIICINDGSTDNSAQILKKYAEKDSRIRVYNQKNQGPSAARNNGIKHSKGKYIQFVDSDDQLELNTIKILYKKAEENNLDMVMFNIKPRLVDKKHKERYENYIKYYKRNKTYPEILSGQEMFYKMKKNSDYLPSPVIYMTKVDLIKKNNITFYEGIIHEDNLFTIQLIFKANRVQHINKEFYIRNVRDDSIMTKNVSIAKTKGLFVCIMELLKFSKTLKLPIEIKKALSDYIIFGLQANLIESLEKLPPEEVQKYKNSLKTKDLILFNLLTQDILKYRHTISTLPTLKKSKKSSRYDRLSLKIGHMLLFIPRKIYRLMKKVKSFIIRLSIFFDKNYLEFKRYYKKEEYKKETALPTVFLITTNNENINNYINTLKYSIKTSFFLNIYNLEKNEKRNFLSFQETKLIKLKQKNSLSKNSKKEFFYIIREKDIIETKPQDIFKDTTSPKVSIIMPTFNSELYLEASITDILNQTFKDFELICVDDGSTDSTVSLLLELSKKDKRIKVVLKNKENAGAGRNLGMKFSTGKYLIFLDSDDRFDKTLIEKMYKKITKTSADVVICNANKFISGTKRILSDNLIFKNRYPEKEVFNHKDLKENLFLFCTPCPWNKMFSKSFIFDNNIEFQSLPRANDVSFTFYSLTKAKKITIIDEKLVNYRIGLETTLQSTNDKSPFSFLKALLFLKEKLIQENLFHGYIKQSFVNMAISNCTYNISTLKNTKNILAVKIGLEKTGFKALNIIGHPKEFYLYGNYEKLKKFFNIKIEEADSNEKT
jgi:glycosyltransferase involved in cell wall biosynthesis